MNKRQTLQSLEESPRFAGGVERRDFLGLTALWSFCATLAVTLAGALRLPLPALFPEKPSRFRIGPPERFPVGVATPLPQHNVLVLRDRQGLRVLSLVCTHLGCVTHPDETGGFTCPCHGSTFDAEGGVLGGPAPADLHYLEVSRSAGGELVVDAERFTDAGTVLAV